MKIGILGGGQLGRMFLQAASNYPNEISILDPDSAAPCRGLVRNFFQGNLQDYFTVMNFGRGLDVIGIEIEHVNVNALLDLERQGKRVIPSPAVLKTIQDKGLQKKFYLNQGIASAPFALFDGEALPERRPKFPLIQKTRTGGYDGKGVQLVRKVKDLWPVPSLLEELCPIDKELAVIVVQNERDCRCYDTVEMLFDERLNLVDSVQMPAQLAPDLNRRAQQLARATAAAFAAPGIYAVEMFLTTGGQLLVNETACRVHNSGHLTIEACASSQFDQMYRLLAGLPLGAVARSHCAMMLNLVGEPADRLNLDKLLAEEQLHLHWYGKSEARPGRKMGHITLLAPDLTKLQARAKKIKELL